MDKKYYLNEWVTVEGTGKDPENFPKGAVREVTSLNAKRLIARGIVKEPSKKAAAEEA